jgi:ribose transport system substrate-binding protein
MNSVSRALVRSSRRGTRPGRRSSRSALATAATVVLCVLLASCGSTSDKGKQSAGKTEREGIDIEAPCPGPNGEPGVTGEDLSLTAAEVAEVRKGGYTAAVTWAGSGPWYDAVDRGFDDALASYGIKRVATASAEYDAAKQAADVENIMAKDPDIILGSPVDAVAAAEAYQPAVDAGKILVFSDSVPKGYVAGKDYVGFVSGNRCKAGELMADAVVDAVGKDGKVGMIYYDADFYVTNILDDYFRAALKQKYPKVQLVAEDGFAQEAATREVAAGMLVHEPEVGAIYVTWSIAAQGAIAALRESGRDDVKVITHDLDPSNDVDLARGDSNMFATVTENQHDLGSRLATLAAYGLLKKKAPPFVAVPYLSVRQDNVADTYRDVLGKVPPELAKAAAE